MSISKTDRIYTVDNIRIGRIIREARLNQRITQEQLSEAVDITPAFIGHIERGSRSLSLPTLAGIANILNIPMSYFFADEEPAPDEKVLNDFMQLVEGRSEKTKTEVLDIVRTALQHLD